MATYPQSGFDREVSSLIAEANREFLANPAAIQEAQEDGERWRHLMEAEDTVGQHGVVLPIDLARHIMEALDRDPEATDAQTASVLTSQLMASMLAHHIEKAERR